MEDFYDECPKVSFKDKTGYILSLLRFISMGPSFTCIHKLS